MDLEYSKVWNLYLGDWLAISVRLVKSLTW